MKNKTLDNRKTSEAFPAFTNESRIATLDRFDSDLKPAISVIVPIFNARATLDEALASIEIQSFPDLEIVCVNDASTDDSGKIIAAHASLDSRYVVLDHVHNCGYGASMNDGIAAARGTWIAILEPDDYLLPDMYERLLATPEQMGADSASVDIIKSAYIREIREDGAVRGDAPKAYLNCRYQGRVKPACQPFTMADPGVAHLLRHHPSIWSALYRRDFLVDNAISFHEYPGSGWADNEFFFDTLLRAQNIVYLDEAFYVYREETAQEFATVARDRKLLRFERWQGMADILDVLDIQDESILAAQISKGFSYANEALTYWGDDDAELNEALAAMFARMDPALVGSEARISPGLKRRYYESRSLSYDPRKDLPRYYRALVGEFVHTLKSNGPAYAFDQVKQVIGHS